MTKHWTFFPVFYSHKKLFIIIIRRMFNILTNTIDDQHRVQHSVRRFENKFIFWYGMEKNPSITKYLHVSISKFTNILFYFVFRSKSNKTEIHIWFYSQNSETLAHQRNASLLSCNFWCVIAFKLLLLLFCSCGNRKTVQVLLQWCSETFSLFTFYAPQVHTVCTYSKIY